MICDGCGEETEDVSKTESGLWLCDYCKENKEGGEEE